MIPRLLKTKLSEALQKNASVALLGPRQVGKTTLAWEWAKSMPSVYLDLENRLDRQKVQDIEAFYRENHHKTIILDEIQRLPNVFSEIRGLIDRSRRAGRKYGQFLFLGSASRDLLKQSSESLAGRISYLELFGLNSLEFLASHASASKQDELWVKGGFPESLLSDDASSLDWRLNFIKTYLERDIPQLGPRIPAETLDRFWTMLAHSQGANLNASKLAGSLNVSSVTIARYVDLMVDLLLVRRLQPYSINIKKRLVKSPRIYVRDSGITHALLNIGSFNDLLGHPISGKSWEGFVIENIYSVLNRKANLFYYRTAKGDEIDLIIEFDPKTRWAVEIKRGTNLKPERGFYRACEDLDPIEKYVIYSGEDEFILPHNVIAIPLLSFLKKLSSLDG